MTDTFDDTVEFLFSLEGYKSDVLGDPGGRTIYGIAETYYPTDVAIMADMDAASAKAYAKSWYRRKVWDEFNCDAIKAPFDSVVFICAVNPGPGFVRAAKGIRDWKDLALETVAYYRARACDGQGAKPCCATGNCKTQRTKCKRKFLVGWLSRVEQVWRKYKSI